MADASGRKPTLKVKRSTFPGCIILEGNLVKSPPIEKLKKSKWEERYFVLIKLCKSLWQNDETSTSGDIERLNKTKIRSKKKNINGKSLSCFCLGYWNDEASRRKGADPIRTIYLNESSVMSYESPFWKTTYDHMLSLKTPRREFLLCAQSQEIKSQWLEALSYATQTKEKTENDGPRMQRAGSCSSNGSDPIYGTLTNVLSLRRSSESWSVQTQDSGYDSIDSSSITSRNNSSLQIGQFHGPIFSSPNRRKLSMDEGTQVSASNLSKNNRRFSAPISIKAEPPPPSRLSFQLVSDDIGEFENAKDGNSDEESDGSGYEDMSSNNFVTQLMKERMKLKESDDKHETSQPRSDDEENRPPPILPRLANRNQNKVIVETSDKKECNNNDSASNSMRKLVFGELVIHLPINSIINCSNNNEIRITTSQYEINLFSRELSRNEVTTNDRENFVVDV